MVLALSIFAPIAHYLGNRLLERDDLIVVHFGSIMGFQRLRFLQLFRVFVDTVHAPRGLSPMAMHDPPHPSEIKMRTRHWKEIAADPEVRAAVRDVDQTLLDWSLALSPLERLRSASSVASTLSRFRRDKTQTG